MATYHPGVADVNRLTLIVGVETSVRAMVRYRPLELHRGEYGLHHKMRSTYFQQLFTVKLRDCLCLCTMCCHFNSRCRDISPRYRSLELHTGGIPVYTTKCGTLITLNYKEELL